MLLQSLMLAATLLAVQAETTFTVEYGGKTYEFRISDQDLQRTPAWPADQETPPLAPRRAIDIARKQLTALLANGADWRLYDVTLRPIDDRWIYLVGFLEPIRDRTAGQQVSAGFQIVVLMNGVAVVPRVSP